MPKSTHHKNNGSLRTMTISSISYNNNKFIANNGNKLPRNVEKTKQRSNRDKKKRKGIAILLIKITHASVIVSLKAVRLAAEMTVPQSKGEVAGFNISDWT